MRIAFSLLLLPLLASAEPGPTIRYLVNEPASLMDIGMLRLDDLTDEFEDRVGLSWNDGEERKWFTAEIGSYFDQDENKIVVSFLAMNSEPNETQMAQGCRRAMAQMNHWLVKRVPKMFQHIGYNDPAAPVEMSSDLMNMFVITCYFSSGRDSSEGRFWAHRKLGTHGDREMTIGKWKLPN